jgi:hypothetical protein
MIIVDLLIGGFCLVLLGALIAPPATEWVDWSSMDNDAEMNTDEEDDI